MRLIDADELIERTWRWSVNSREAVQQMIKGCPTVDAEPVVRCKDCKYWDDEDHACGLRDCYGWDYKPYSFCSWAERRDENADDPD